MSSFSQHAQHYSNRLHDILKDFDWRHLNSLCGDLLTAWQDKTAVYICGNGGSANNANHIANDMIYGLSKQYGSGIRMTSLSANVGTLTCLANDVGYDHIYAHQLAIMGKSGDILIVLSGSGNSPNILKAIETAQSLNMRSYGILGFDGGKAKSMVNTAIHTPINDMQISEDAQLIFFHIIMQYLYTKRNDIKS